MPRQLKPQTAADMKARFLAILAKMETSARQAVKKHGVKVCESAYQQRLVAIEDVRHAVDRL